MTHLKSKLITAIVVLLLLSSFCSCSGDSDYDETDYYSSGTIVYVTKTGEKYHRSSCRHLSQSKIEINLEEAQSKGYGRCSVCNPPIEY